MAEATTLRCGACALVPSIERVELPADLAATLRCRSSFARRGVLIGGGFVDPGFRGQLTLCLTNMGAEPVTLAEGDRVVQMVIQEVRNGDRLYQGSTRTVRARWRRDEPGDTFRTKIPRDPQDPRGVARTPGRKRLSEKMPSGALSERPRGPALPPPRRDGVHEEGREPGAYHRSRHRRGERALVDERIGFIISRLERCVPEHLRSCDRHGSVAYNLLRAEEDLGGVTEPLMRWQPQVTGS